MTRKPFQRKNPSAVTVTDNHKSSSPSSAGDTYTCTSLRPSFDRLESYYKPEEFKGCEFPLVYKPKVIKKIDDGCYVFHCITKGNSGSRFNKNMIVLLHMVHVAQQQQQQQHESDASVDDLCCHLSVVNPLRLTDEGEEKLLELGTWQGASSTKVVNLIRLGPSEHAAFEDDYYLRRFQDDNIQRWAPGPFSNCPHLPLDQTLFDTTNTRTLTVDAPIAPPSPYPLHLLRVFVFEETVQPEALLWYTPKKLLVTGDCLQCQVDNPFVDDDRAGGLDHLRDHGLLVAPVVIPQPWLQSQSVVANRSRKVKNSFQSRAQKNNTFFSSSGKFKLRNDFARLLKLDDGISRMVSTSGNQVLQTIKVVATIIPTTITTTTTSNDNDNDNTANGNDTDTTKTKTKTKTTTRELTVRTAIQQAVDRACRLV